MPVPAVATEPELEPSMLARAARILYAFGSGAPELSLADLVRKTGLPRSSVHRILNQLVALRALERSGNDYRLGIGILELGGLAAHHNRLHECALPQLHAVHARTGLAAHLSILDGHEIFYIDKVGVLPPGIDPSHAGGRQPAYCTASGKAIVAFSAPHLAEQVIATGTPPRTSATLDAEQLRRELGQVREQGVAHDRGENYRNIHCIAAPVRDNSGFAVAAVSITGPRDRINQRPLVTLLLTAAQRIGRAFASGRRHHASCVT
ncbi:IclR family transcriptional regulator [Hoyosella altamirensis]|uniref:DNA-binding IclR family transcriptional regulator n=1 Tax=Hoyosella altamirensis TaxID=616997 RepID=A0A839RTU3_9ACTN|nr:IclR family transcriptional regulator [Hoyosella altamirensis]MBB3039231.1 DNA-binding IclR family transcriptional regulator [Hoyosella altamirensis]